MEAITSTQNHEIEEEGHVHPLQIHETEEESIHSQNDQNEEEEEEEESSPSQVAIDAVWLSLTEEKTKKVPKLLNVSADSRSCSIFRVPQNIMKLHHSNFFQPAMVSIGPYYHGEEHLQMIEEHKWRILRGNLNRQKVTLHDLFKAIAVKEKEIRGCYSENIDKFTSHKLIETMILDGCFIVELLCVAGRIIIPEANDPLFNMSWMLSSLTRDLLMLENQIPLFVLQILYDKSVADHFEDVPSLQELILTLINYTLPRYKDTSKLCEKYKDGTGKHILDFYRSTFIPEVDNDHAAGDQETTIWSRCCCCLSVCSSSKQDKISVGSTLWSWCCCLRVGPSSKKEEINDRSDSLELLLKETTDARDLKISSSQKETTIHTNSLQSLSQEETADQGGSEEKLSEIEETRDAEESVQLNQHMDEARGKGNQFKKWFIHPVKKFGGLVGIQFKKKADTDQDLQKTDTDENLLQFIQPVEKLRVAGIKFKKREGTDSFLDIDFSNGALRIPLLITGETMSTLILNCIAFEQCYKHRSKHFTSYFNFMGYLINTTFDAGYLREKKIIENFFGTDKELVKFFKEVGKNIPYYFEEDYLMKVAQKVEIYYRNNCHVRWAEFKHKYCGSLWIVMSAFAAVFVILLSILQSVLALIRFIKHSP